MAVLIKKEPTPPNPIVVGLDVSTVTGWAVMGKDDCEWGEWKSEPEVDRYVRWEKLANQCGHLLDRVNPSLVVIEGYALFSRTAIATMVEVGAMIRRVVWSSGCRVLEVPPTQNKRFLTGSGNARKEHMMVGVYKELGIETRTDNEADAIALALLGTVYEGLRAPRTTAQRQVIGDLRERYGSCPKMLAGFGSGKKKAQRAPRRSVAV